MKVFKLLLASLFFFYTSGVFAQDADTGDAYIFGSDLGWIKFNNTTGFNIEVDDQVSDGCWTNIAAVKNAVALQLIRSGYEAYTGDDHKAFAPTVWIVALGFAIPSVNGCAVAIELSVNVPNVDVMDSEEGALSSLYVHPLASYTGLVTAKKSGANDSIKSQFEDLTQTMLVEAQKEKQKIVKALTEHQETSATKYWLRQIK